MISVSWPDWLVPCLVFSFEADASGVIRIWPEAIAALIRVTVRPMKMDLAIVLIFVIRLQSFQSRAMRVNRVMLALAFCPCYCAV